MRAEFMNLGVAVVAAGNDDTNDDVKKIDMEAANEQVEENESEILNHHYVSVLWERQAYRDP